MQARSQEQPQVDIQGPSWDLSAEYDSVDDEKLRADLAALDSNLKQAQEMAGPLAEQPDAGDAIEIAQQLAKLETASDSLLGNVMTYTHCLLSVDAQDEAALKLQGGLQAYIKRINDAFEPLAQYLDSAHETTIATYLADAEIAPSEFQVAHRRERRHENLDLAQERLVNGLSQDGIHAWGRLYDQLSGSVKCDVVVGNETQELGIAQAAGMLGSPNDAQRQAAWRGINGAWESHQESCAAAINAISGWRLEMCEQRSGEKPVHYLDAPLHMNRITRPTLDALLGATAKAKPLAQRAARLQARAYGKAGFGPWDVRAPAPVLGDAGGQQVPFAEAQDLIAQCYGAVDGEMADFVRMMVDKNWVEGTVGPRKTPGAYCTGFSKSRTPRVYMTYTGRGSDIITLAHELGHALHAWVMRDLPLSQTSYGMSLAETASTFGETTVRDGLLQRAETPQQKLDIVWEEMSAMTSFLLNIPTRFEFENRLYEARSERPLQAQELKSMMGEAWQSWYGDSLAEPDPMFWASKLHFYISGLSFYNFPYLFGYLFSQAVYAKRAELGDQFYPWFVELLRDTGRMTAEDLAIKHMGASLRDESFWADTIATLAGRVDAFEKLLDELGV